MSWEVLIRSKTAKNIETLPKENVARIKEVFYLMRINHYQGDIEKMEGEKNVWRRRVGSYRIFYELFSQKKVIYIFRVERRTTTTYRKR